MLCHVMRVCLLFAASQLFDFRIGANLNWPFPLRSQYFFHYLGLDRNLRDQFRGHQWWDYVVEFCAKVNFFAF